jgi:hypothetical protein
VAQNAAGVIKVAAKKAGISENRYIALVSSGMKWCSGCRAWHSRDEFGSDKSRFDGKSAHCFAIRKNRFYSHDLIPVLLVKPFGPPRLTARDGDKNQARKHVQLSFRSGRIPHPNSLACVDCGHLVPRGATRRRDMHEYDHYLGYAAENHMKVQPVCVPCHHKREKARGAKPGRRPKHVR